MTELQITILIIVSMMLGSFVFDVFGHPGMVVVIAVILIVQGLRESGVFL